MLNGDSLHCRTSDMQDQQSAGQRGRMEYDVYMVITVG